MHLTNHLQGAAKAFDVSKLKGPKGGLRGRGPGARGAALPPPVPKKPVEKKDKEGPKKKVGCSCYHANHPFERTFSCAAIMCAIMMLMLCPAHSKSACSGT